MPIDINGQGWNAETTQLKQEWFSRFAYFHLNLKHYEITQMIGRRFFRPAYYQYIDMTAGCGYLPLLGDGSPVRHAIASEKHRRKRKGENPLRVSAHLIEENPDTFYHLQKTLDMKRKLMRCDPLYDSMIYNERYQKVIPEMFFRNGQSENGIPCFGLLYCDPNGQIPEFELLKQLNAHHPRLDVLLHVSASNIKRVKGTHGGLSLLECMQHSGKRHWKIARLGTTRHQWAFLYGTNVPNMLDRADLNLYSVRGSVGKDVFHILNFTERERAMVCA